MRKGEEEEEEEEKGNLSMIEEIVDDYSPLKQ